LKREAEEFRRHQKEREKQLERVLREPSLRAGTTKKHVAFAQHRRQQKVDERRAADQKRLEDINRIMKYKTVPPSKFLLDIIVATQRGKLQ
jgi:hypothetical protein